MVECTIGHIPIHFFFPHGYITPTPVIEKIVIQESILKLYQILLFIMVNGKVIRTRFNSLKGNSAPIKKVS